jgi:hypothetical protein
MSPMRPMPDALDDADLSPARTRPRSQDFLGSGSPPSMGEADTCRAGRSGRQATQALRLELVRMAPGKHDHGV